jgi:glycosyltransferase involved in cell wall biosynthesis
VFDLDDAVFRRSPSLEAKGRSARWLYGPQQALALMRRANAIVVSTPALADMLPPDLPPPTVLPTVPDPAAFGLVEHRPDQPITIGWTGTVGGLTYLDPLAPVFERLAAEQQAFLEVVSTYPWTGPARFHRWRLEDEISLFQRFAIGIMPLPDTDYTRAKAGFKLLQYMAAGIPVVASPIGVNRELVEQSGGGYLASTPDEWEECLRLLAADHELRSRLGRQGRSFVERYADLDAHAVALGQLLAGG